MAGVRVLSGRRRSAAWRGPILVVGALGAALGVPLGVAACHAAGRPSADTSRAAPALVSAHATPQPMPPTGATVEVRMVGEGQQLRFDPSSVTVKVGDAVRFRLVSQGPANVAFDPATLPAGAKDQLDANMPARVDDLSSPLLLNPGETYTISFAGMPRGVYPFHCTPRLAQGMKGTIVVE